MGISLKFGSLDKMKIITSEPKDYLGRSGNGVFTYMGLKNIVRSKKKKSRHDIDNVSMKKNLRIIHEFEMFPYKVYVRKRPDMNPLTVDFI